MAPITVKKIESREVKKFIDFPHDLYKDDPFYVPELYISQAKLFDRKKNPFFQHANVDLFLAYRDGKIVGRIAAIDNGGYKKFTGNNDGFFGFFDVEEDYAVAEALLNTAGEWARQKGLTSLVGPVNFSTNDTCGMLIDSYNVPPVMLMTYNKKYYNDFMERFGFQKKMDLLAYKIETKQNMNQRVIAMRPLLENRLKRDGIVIRKFNMKNFKSEVDKLHEVYNAAWEKNWGFVPMTKDEFRFAASDMKAIVDTDFAYVAEHHGKAIGFALTVPNLNEVTINIKRGRLFPTGLFKLLMNQKKVKSVRIITLGVIEGYRKAGIDACFYAMNLEAASRKNIEYGEASWILENNDLMNKALLHIGGKVYKKYRIYQMSVN
jgi:GNAT superfamily N-acetyltransferase